MPERLLHFSLCLLLVLLAAAAAYGQKPNQATPDPDDEGDAVLQPAQPEPPKQVLNIDVKNGHMSVELSNVDFGTAIRAIAGKAGFKIEGSGPVFSRKLNTKFSNIEIERGVTRLLSLVQESNYMLHFNTGGAISSLEIFPATGGAASPGVRQPQRSQIPQRQLPARQQPQQPQPSAVTPPGVPVRPIRPPTRPTAPPPRPVQPQVLPDDNEEDEENVQEVPYVPPQPKQPLFAPKRR
jgi:hypothetical protein